MIINPIVANFFLGYILGFMQVGSILWRTLQVVHGNYLGVLFSSTLIAISYYLGILLIINNNISGYIGFSFGAATISMYLAYQENKKKEDEKSNSK